MTVSGIQGSSYDGSAGFHSSAATRPNSDSFRLLLQPRAAANRKDTADKLQIEKYKINITIIADPIRKKGYQGKFKKNKGIKSTAISNKCEVLITKKILKHYAVGHKKCRINTAREASMYT